MNTTPLRRLAVASAALAVAAAPAVATVIDLPASAASRTAETSVDTTYLADTLGLPSGTVVEPVTYDRFQWLLQQPGQFAFVIGSATDANFAARVQDVDAQARTAGAAKVYWFDPNLSGYTGIRNLDTRNPAGINLTASSQTVFGNVWKNILGQYLGNGIKATPDSKETSVSVSANDAVVNDAVDPVWDYRSDATPAVTSTDDVFFVYDKDRTVDGAADKIADWVNLSTTTDAAAEVADAFTAIGGAAGIDQLSQFAWWESSANRKHNLAYPDDARYGGDILDDADDAAGWRIQQVTYPELLHLLNLKGSADTNFAILFGGTWCHNTRAVIKDVNAQAQNNGVTTVYNFDLVLDGGTINGTNGGTNPLHVRDNANSGSTFDFRPSYLYGDLVRTYFKNLITEYDPNSGSRVAYFPGGDLNAFPDVVRKLQVPFVLNYQRGTGTSPSSTAVKRQWIQQTTDSGSGLPTFKEYMSEWWYTHPSAQLGQNFAIPADESTLSASQQAQLSQARSQVAFAQDGLAKLAEFFGGLPGAALATRTVSAPAITYGADATVAVSVTAPAGHEPSGELTLHVHGSDYPAIVSGGSATFTVSGLAAGSYPFTVTYPGNAQVLGFTDSGSLTVTKAAVTSLEGEVHSRPTPSKTGTYTVTVSTPSGLAQATGAVTVTFTQGSTVTTATGSVSAGTATVTIPKLVAGTWKASIAYAGNANYAAATAKAGSFVSTATTVNTSTGSIATPRATGSAGGRPAAASDSSTDGEAGNSPEAIEPSEAPTDAPSATPTPTPAASVSPEAVLAPSPAPSVSPEAVTGDSAGDPDITAAGSGSRTPPAAGLVILGGLAAAGAIAYGASSLARRSPGVG